MSQALLLGSSSSTRSNRILCAGAIGNVQEWYDFAIFGCSVSIYLTHRTGDGMTPGYHFAASSAVSLFGLLALIDRNGQLLIAGGEQ